MDSRDITWVCSRCGARFSTKEDLNAHVAGHEGRASASTPSEDIVKPSTPAVEPPAREPQQTSPGQAVEPESDATVVSTGRKPAAALERLPRSVARTSSRRVSLLVALVAVCAVAAVLSIAFPHQIAHQIGLAVTKQSTPLTELYFNNPKSLPKSLSMSRPNLFKFSVVNHEGHDTVYSYVVTLVSRQGGSTVAQGRIDLRNSSEATRLVNVRPTRRATEYLTTVKLLGRTETIWFRGMSP